MNRDMMSKTVGAEDDFGPAACLNIFRKDHFKTTVILLYAALALSVWKYIPPILTPTRTPAEVRDFKIGPLPGYPETVEKALADKENPMTVPWSVLMAGERKIFAAFLLMGLIPIGIVKWVFREKLADYGLCFGNFLTLRSMLIFTPLMILLAFWASLNPDYYLVYPFNPLVVGAGTGRFLIHAVLYALCYYFAWEFMFRGFMLRGLTPNCGPYAAILIQTLAAAMLHYGHPLSEVLGSVGGSFFWGVLYFRTRSIYSGFIQHAALGIALDYFIMTRLAS